MAPLKQLFELEALPKFVSLECNCVWNNVDLCFDSADFQSWHCRLITGRRLVYSARDLWVYPELGTWLVLFVKISWSSIFFMIYMISYILIIKLCSLVYVHCKMMYFKSKIYIGAYSSHPATALSPFPILKISFLSPIFPSLFHMILYT